MNFFRGFIRLNGKKAIDKFKDVDVLNFESVKDCKSYAGVLEKTAVCIDVDDEVSSEKLLDIIESENVRCLVNKTTRGRHFFFKNDNSGAWDKCSSDSLLALGIKADVKVGKSNAYAVLRKDGVDRWIEYDIEADEDYDAPPVWLRRVKTNIELNGVEEGGGRNDALFRYIMPLQEAGFTKEQIVETLRVVNKYVFAKPLSKSEFETITRDEAFETALVPSFYEGKHFLFDKFAHYLVTELHVRRVNGALHIYDNGVYVDGYRRIEKKMIDLLPNLTKAKRGEVLDYLEVIVSENSMMADAHYVAFKNGILDVETGELLPFSPDFIITNRINWDYRKEAKCDLVDKTLLKLACGDQSLVDLLEETVGYCFFRRNELRKAFIFTGGARGGKSTYIAMLLKLIGEENTSSLDLKELGDRFKTAELFGKLANLGDDIGDEFISDTAVFKKLVSGDRLTAERKGKDPFAFSNYSKMIFSANQLPRVKDRVGAVIDRLIVVPFNAQFSKEDADFDPFIKTKLCRQDAIERLIVLGVAGLRRVLENNRFTTSESVEKSLQEYNELNNPIIGFFKEIREEDGEDALEREPIAYWYARYSEYCLANQLQALSRREFTTQTMREFGLEIKVGKVDRKSVRMFKKCV